MRIRLKLCKREAWCLFHELVILLSHKSVNHKNRTVGFVELRLNPVPELKAHRMGRLSANNNFSLFLTQINFITSRISHQSYGLILLCCFWNPGYFHFLFKYIKMILHPKNENCHNLLFLTCMTFFLLQNTKEDIFEECFCPNNAKQHWMSFFRTVEFRKRMWLTQV